MREYYVKVKSIFFVLVMLLFLLFFATSTYAEDRNTEITIGDKNIAAINIGENWKQVLMCGDNEFGQCKTNEWNNVVDIGVGNGFVVGLKSDGTVLTIGDNQFGQCNTSNWSNIKSIKVESGYTVGLRNDGTVIGTGENSYGECDVSNWSNIKEINVANNNTIGIKNDGTAVATGNNQFGQCNISDWSNIIDVSIGENFIVGLRSNGTVVAVGDNQYGQCNVSQLENIVSIKAGKYHLLALRNDGTVVAIGKNDYNQCDTSTWTGIIQIEVGDNHSIGLKNDYTVVTAGDNSLDQLNVTQLSYVKKIFAKHNNSAFLKLDNSLLVIGNDEFGQCEFPSNKQQFSGGNGSKSNPFQISTPEQLNDIRLFNSSNFYFCLISDIDLKNYKNWSPISGSSNDGFSFSNFDGNNHKIINLQIDRPKEDCVGLFGKTYNLKIYNLRLENVKVNGKNNVGALLGDANAPPSNSEENSIITNCSATGVITGKSKIGGLIGQTYNVNLYNCYADINLQADILKEVSDVGGLIGCNTSGKIDNCSSSGVVQGKARPIGGLIGNNSGTLTKCNSSVKVDGYWDVGGLVGLNSFGGSISQCYSNGDVTGSNDSVGGLVGGNYYNSSINSSYSTSKVSGPSNIGELVGENNNAEIKNCYSNGNISGDNGIGGLVGRNKSKGIIENSYSASIILSTYNSNIGGLVGLSDNLNINNSYYNKDTSKQTDTDKGIPKSTAEMKQKATFEGWDFANVWNIAEGVSYPTFMPQKEQISNPPYLVGNTDNLIEITIGDPIQLPSKISINSETDLTVVTINVVGYTDEYASVGPTVGTKSFRLNSFTIDTSKAPFTIPGTYTLNIWAKSTGCPEPTMPIGSLVVKVLDVEKTINISGTVYRKYTDNKAVIPKATVNLNGSPDPKWNATTDDKGSFHFEGVCPGTEIRVSADGYEDGVAYVNSDNDVNPIIIVMPYVNDPYVKLYTVGGRVVNKRDPDTGIAGVKIELVEDENNDLLHYIETTDQYGGYFFKGVGPGINAITFSKDGYVDGDGNTIVSKQISGPYDITINAELINMDGLYTISGTVTYKNNPFPYAEVKIKGQKTFNAHTNSQGKFTIPGVSNGTWSLVATKDKFYGSSTVTITKRDISNANIIMSSPDDVSGISFDPTKLTLNDYSPKRLNPIITPSTALNKKVYYSSENESVATVDGNGWVTPIKTGETYITATTEDGGFIAKCAIEVNVPEIEIVTTSLNYGVVGLNYNVTLKASGGTPPYTWGATGLPRGININPYTGAISGIPIEEGLNKVVITLKDSLDRSMSLGLVLNIFNQQGFKIILKEDNNGFSHNSIGFLRKDTKDGSYYDVGINLMQRLLSNQTEPYRQNIITAAKETWGGSCFGISTTIALTKLGLLDVTNFGKINENYFKQNPATNVDFRHLINYYQLAQYTQEYQNSSITIHKSDSDEKLKTILEDIVRRAKNIKSGGNPFLLSYGYEWKDIDKSGKVFTESDGHALLVCGYEKTIFGINKITFCDPNGIEDFYYLEIPSDYTNFTLTDANHKGNNLNPNVDKSIYNYLQVSDFECFNDIDADGLLNDLNCHDLSNSDDLISPIIGGSFDTDLWITELNGCSVSNSQNNIMNISDSGYSGDLKPKSVHYISNATIDGDSPPEAIYTFEGNDTYSITPNNGKIKASITNNKYFASVNADNISRVDFTNDNGINIDGNKGNYTIYISNLSGNDSGMISISGSNANKIIISQNSQGLLLTSDDLKNIEISSCNTNNLRESRTVFSTNKKQVLIKNKENDDSGVVQIVTSSNDDDYDHAICETQIISTLTVMAGTGGTVTSLTGAVYIAGDKINIEATPNPGYRFVNWTSSDGGSFADANCALTTFNMPGNATTLIAHFTPINISGDNVSGDGGDSPTTPVDWNSIRNIINSSKVGDSIKVYMIGENTVPTYIFESLKNKDLNLEINMDGYKWIINGKSIENIPIDKKSFSFKVIKVNEANLSTLAEKKDITQIKLIDNGALPFNAILSINVGRQNSGKCVFLYNFDEHTNKLDYCIATKVDKNGQVELVSNHILKYVLTTEILANTTIRDNTLTISKNDTDSFVPFYVENGKELPVILSAMRNNSITFVAPKTSVYSYKDNTKNFIDIESHWSKENIHFVTARELLSGTGNKKFSPNDTMTRGMLVTVLGRLYGIDVSAYKNKTLFTDVDTNAWYAPYVAWVTEKGIVKGIGDNKFAPNKAISREEMAVIIVDYLKFMNITLLNTSSEKVFFDIDDIAPWASSAVKTINNTGVMNGKPGNIFDPKGTTTRAEVCAIMKRLIESILIK